MSAVWQSKRQEPGDNPFQAEQLVALQWICFLARSCAGGASDNRWVGHAHR